MRLIDADALEPDADYDDGDYWAVSMAQIQNAPTIEPERKTGKWIHDGYDHPHGVDWMHCSECGRKDVWCPATRTNFCPTCGTKMEEGGQE